MQRRRHVSSVQSDCTASPIEIHLVIFESFSCFLFLAVTDMESFLKKSLNFACVSCGSTLACTSGVRSVWMLCPCKRTVVYPGYYYFVICSFHIFHLYFCSSILGRQITPSWKIRLIWNYPPHKARYIGTIPQKSIKKDPPPCPGSKQIAVRGGRQFFLTAIAPACDDWPIRARARDPWAPVGYASGI